MGILGILAYLSVWSTHQIVGTVIARGLPRERSTFVMYATAAILGVSLALATGSAVLNAGFLLVSFVGGYQAWVGYAELFALRYSLTLTSVVLPLRFVLSAALAAVFLGEAELYRDPFMMLGVILLFVATILFRKGEKTPDGNVSLAPATQMCDRGTFGQWLLAISVMVVLAGTAGFAMKYFASELEVPRLAFPSYWYSGAVIGIAPVLLLNRAKNFVRVSRRDFLVPLRGATAIGQITLEFVVYQLLPLAVAAPSLAFGTTVLPVGIGLIGFGERKEVSRLQLAALAVGFTGALLLVVART
ncbi:MAG: hypothetical protein A2940_02310 [Candidatus Wildermuthbacteria bacterium RIFCSPLOWO2_01_FULL_48_29]|uniref:EamA domain-containing protein n=2 Tax=Candidatus Wildermuthiibacteriota TaxID=1817923 RepID=A0A1G2RL04_9BACT|nr:MAG: hypothetical protein A2843_02025 [Candidatus Wildermuthbacteria bacterium RIFCSPHIGHO2_01_FULL_48_27b]OHA73516.1 MAG: hypothetical protein A2940_02310 [Candidatus Wildermuthbacteria bacterium RIFCSPLOWO2_01_FULL_48_29]